MYTRSICDLEWEEVAKNNFAGPLNGTEYSADVVVRKLQITKSIAMFTIIHILREEGRWNEGSSWWEWTSRSGSLNYFNDVRWTTEWWWFKGHLDIINIIFVYFNYPIQSSPVHSSSIRLEWETENPLNPKLSVDEFPGARQEGTAGGGHTIFINLIDWVGHCDETHREPKEHPQNRVKC